MNLNFENLESIVRLREVIQIKHKLERLEYISRCLNTEQKNRKNEKEKAIDFCAIVPILFAVAFRADVARIDNKGDLNNEIQQQQKSIHRRVKHASHSVTPKCKRKNERQRIDRLGERYGK
eukprot:98383_1